MTLASKIALGILSSVGFVTLVLVSLLILEQWVNGPEDPGGKA